MHAVFGLLSLDGQKRRAHDVAWELDQLAVADALGREREFAAPRGAPPQTVGAAEPGKDLIERRRGDTIEAACRSKPAARCNSSASSAGLGII